MLLTLTTTHHPATDLGYLLHKHPDRCQTFELSFGQAQVFYPEATPERCTAALILEIDPVKLVRGKTATSLEHYVNDRPYVASSFLSVAIAQVFSTALSGRSKDRPELAETPIPLHVKIPVLPCRGGQDILHRLFEPLGYHVTAVQHPLDEQFPEWGTSAYFSVELSATLPLQVLLSHLYVLIPVLDEDKHYWIDDDEVDKLLRHGKEWLADHPEKTQITERYLKRQRHLAKAALAQLVAEDGPDLETHDQQEAAIEEQASFGIEKPISLNQHRIETVVQTLKDHAAKRVIDLGCGEGRLIRALAADNFFEQISGMDVSYRSLEIARDRLERTFLGTKQRERIQLFQGALTYRDRRFKDYDAATLIEVIEHLDESRLSSLAQVVFRFAQPQVVLITTPNVEYNGRFTTLPTGKFRHPDHRFEWTRQEFATWATQISEKFGYTVKFSAIGTDDPSVGAPTQMAVFERSQI
jgi:3' terminal RNA ribose 2'-O-methyltransferase Hen1